jgi:CRP-like cAMP-binding protein
MTLIEKLFALRARYPFSRLRPEDLLVVADAAILREFKPGRVLAPRGGTLHHLFIRVSGTLVDDAGEPTHDVVGTTVLLTGSDVPYTLQAGPDGYRALCLPRGKLLTIIQQCPALLIGFFEMPLHAPRATGTPRPTS